jgi:hypothetical protein
MILSSFSLIPIFYPPLISECFGLLFALLQFNNRATAGKNVYRIDIISLLSDFVVLPKTYIMLHIVTVACPYTILFYYLSMLLAVAPGEKIVAICNDLLLSP